VKLLSAGRSINSDYKPFYWRLTQQKDALLLLLLTAESGVRGNISLQWQPTNIPRYRIDVARPVNFSAEYLLVDAERLVVEVRRISAQHIQ